MAISAVGNDIQNPEVDVTFTDDERATYHAIHWLIAERGHKRIAMIHASLKFPVTIRQRDAFRLTMSDAGLHIPDAYMMLRDWSIEAGRNAIAELMALPEPHTAVFCASDTIAIGALEAALEMNYRIPEDIAIIGFDELNKFVAS